VTRPWAAPRTVTSRFTGASQGHPASVFFLFSSRLGCLGSLAVSALLTLLVLLLLDVL
jgi:hypothetical protein